MSYKNQCYQAYIFCVANTTGTVVKGKD